MHILIIPSWYPTKENPIAGIFFKEQAEALAEKVNNVGVLAVNKISIINFKKIIKEKIFFYKIAIDSSILNTVMISYVVFPKIKLLQYLQRKVLHNLVVKKYIKKFGKPDLCHLHSFSRGDVAFLLKKKYGIPYVVTEHFSGFARKLLSKKDIEFAKEVFKAAEQRIAVSRKFSDHLYSFTGQKFIYISNMTDPNYFKIITKNKTSNVFKFLTIGSLDENKNQIMLIEAFYQKFKNSDNVKLIIAGEGPCERKLKDKVKKLNLENKIIFYGAATREQVKMLYNNSDVFVLPSKYETFGVVLIEALSCGLPVIATKCGGPESIIVDSNIGELVEINKNDLADAMEKLILNKNKYNEEYIRKYAVDNFSKDVVTSKLIELYKSVLIRSKNNK